MTTLPVALRAGHLFAEIDGEPWLIDTGSPSSFGARSQLDLADRRFPVPSSQLGLTAEKLSGLVGVPCTGLIGADLLGGLDHVFDASAGRWTASTDELAHEGRVAHLDEVLGIPVLTARVNGAEHRLIFDTGAQLSYLPAEQLAPFPPAGRVADFYPGFGEFETETHDVPLTLAGITYTLRCGALPGLLAATLSMSGTIGIIGNAILADRPVGYFPRRGLLVL